MSRTMTIPTVGRILDYSLRASDVDAIKRRRDAGTLCANTHTVGQIVPLVVARVWPNEDGAGRDGVNGQAMLDGDGTLWICSALSGHEPGEWMWPERAPEPRGDVLR